MHATLGKVTVVKIAFEMYEPLPADYKGLLRQIQDSHAADLIALRQLLDSNRFMPSVYWPTREHVETEIRMLDAFLAGCHAELQSERRGDLNWWRAQVCLREAEEYAVAKQELPVPCLARLEVRRPRSRRCPDDEQWGRWRRCHRYPLENPHGS